MTQNKKNKSFLIRSIFIAFVISLLLIAIIVFSALNWEPKPDPASEKLIREAAAFWLNPLHGPSKKPNELTDEDFKNIKSFALQKPRVALDYEVEISDIRLLEKFTNLNELSLVKINYPESAIPKWVRILSKLGIYNLKERFAIDLSPLAKLTKLEKLNLGTIQIKSIKPLAGLVNLKQLDIGEAQISDFEPIKGLKTWKS
jgi:hypothetical protein